MSRDPSGFDVGVNLYLGLNADPVNLRDPTGVAPIGWVYVIEAVQGGAHVVYVGSAKWLRSRFSKHHWKALIQAKGTKIRAARVSGRLNISKSGRGSIRSAENEALRSPEQKTMDEVKREMARAEPGERPQMLNKPRAAAEENVELWAKRHRVRLGRWQTIKESGGTINYPAIGVLFTAADFAMMYLQAKHAQYGFAPYVLEDDGGTFTFGENGGRIITTYFKRYLEPGASDEEISKEEFEQYRDEAEALWGTLDWKQDFVPGLLRPELPVVEPPPEVEWY